MERLPNLPDRILGYVAAGEVNPKQRESRDCEEMRDSQRKCGK